MDSKPPEPLVVYDNVFKKGAPEPTLTDSAYRALLILSWCVEPSDADSFSRRMWPNSKWPMQPCRVGTDGRAHHPGLALLRRLQKSGLVEWRGKGPSLRFVLTDFGRALLEKVDPDPDRLDYRK